MKLNFGEMCIWPKNIDWKEASDVDRCWSMLIAVLSLPSSHSLSFGAALFICWVVFEWRRAELRKEINCGRISKKTNFAQFFNFEQFVFVFIFVFVFFADLILVFHGIYFFWQKNQLIIEELNPMVTFLLTWLLCDLVVVGSIPLIFILVN